MHFAGWSTRSAIWLAGLATVPALGHNSIPWSPESDGDYQLSRHERITCKLFWTCVICAWAGCTNRIRYVVIRLSSVSCTPASNLNHCLPTQCTQCVTPLLAIIFISNIRMHALLMQKSCVYWMHPIRSLLCFWTWHLSLCNPIVVWQKVWKARKMLHLGCARRSGASAISWRYISKAFLLHGPRTIDPPVQ